VCAHGRVPAEIAPPLAVAPDDHVGDLPGQARNAERRRFLDLDSLDIGGGNLLQLRDRASGLVGRALAVDQHILGSLAQAAGVVCGTDGEPRHLRQHVIRRGRREAGEVGGRIDLDAPGRG
jgi:hypothetical protein